MASTRLPGKPLADIHGRPMIVHVLDRGREADIGPVAVACGDAEIADAVRAARRHGGADRSDAAARLRPRVRRTGGTRPAGSARRGGEPAGRLPHHHRRSIAAGAGAAGRPGLSTSRTLVAPIASDDGGQHRRRSSRPPARSTEGAAVAPALYFSRAADPVGRRAALASCRHLRLPPGGAGALRRAAAIAAGAAGEPGAAACAGGRHAHRLCPHRACAVRRRYAGATWNGRAAPCCRQAGSRMTGTIAFQGIAGRLLRPRLPGRLSGHGHAALRIVRDRDGRGAGGAGGARHAAVREQPRRAGAGHPPPAAGIRPVRDRRALPSRRALPARREGRRDRRPEAGAFAYRGARPGASQPAPARADAGGAGGHGRRGRSWSRSGTARRRRRSPRRWRRRSTGSMSWRQRRGRLAQHDAVLRHGARSRGRRSRRSPI